MYSGHLDEALELCEQLLAEARAASDLNRQADTLYMMSEVAFKNEQLDDARAYLHETAELAMAYGGYPLRLIDVLDKSGHLCAATGKYAAAISLWSAYAAQNKAAGLADTPEVERARQLPLRAAKQALNARQVKTAEVRGAAMTARGSGGVRGSDYRPEIIRRRQYHRNRKPSARGNANWSP